MSLVLGPGSFFLVGIDLKKDEVALLRAYNDPDGPIWSFNLNILERINRELGCNLDRRNFRHQAIYNNNAGRIEAAIFPVCDQEITIGSHRFTLLMGEPIVLEYSHKYTVEDFQALAREAGRNPCDAWVDSENLFSVHLLSNRDVSV